MIGDAFFFTTRNISSDAVTAQQTAIWHVCVCGITPLYPRIIQPQEKRSIFLFYVGWMVAKKRVAL